MDLIKDWASKIRFADLVRAVKDIIVSLKGSRVFPPSLTSALVFCVSPILINTIYCVFWRLYLSPIAKFPGPRFAALTFWNEFYYDVILGGKYSWKILEYHHRYGPIVRINPYELHINDPWFYDHLYVSSSKGKTDKWGWSMRMFGTVNNSAYNPMPHIRIHTVVILTEF